MGVQFIEVVLFALVMLVVPGYLGLRALGLPRALSLSLSPAISIGLYSILGLVYGRFGLSCTPLTLVAIPSLLLFAACALKRCRVAQDLSVPVVSWPAVVLYLFIGLAVGWVFFVRRLPSYDAIMQRWDLAHHINTIRAFADSGIMSPLYSSSYATPIDKLIDVNPAASFYPSAYHMVCALSVQFVGAGAGLTMNVMNYVFAFAVYPLSVLSLIATVFPNRKRIQLWGALASVMLVVFPWGLLVFGPIYPNLAGFSILPAVVSLFIWLVRGLEQRNGMGAKCAIFLVAIIGAFCLHPNVLFSMGVFLIPWIAMKLFYGEGKHLSKSHGGIAAICFLVLCAVLWVCAYKFPLLKDTVSMQWNPYATPSQAIVNILTLAYVDGFSPVAAQIVPGAILVVGLVVVLHHRDERWLAYAYALSVILVFVDSVCASDSSLRMLLTGFWYNDPYRIAAMACIIATPILASGLDTLYGGVKVLVVRDKKNTRCSRSQTVEAVVVTAGAVFLLTFYPSFNLPGNGTLNMAFSTYRANVQSCYGDDAPYSKSESDFVNQAKEIVGDDVVINNPYDGSVLAYGNNDIRCYYRYFQGFGNDSETPDSKEIREHLSSLATDEEVKKAVEDVDAKYVLVLNVDDIQGTYIAPMYNANLWSGITTITDETPGFTPVLESGDMCLYRIAA